MCGEVNALGRNALSSAEAIELGLRAAMLGGEAMGAGFGARRLRRDGALWALAIRTAAEANYRRAGVTGWHSAHGPIGRLTFAVNLLWEIQHGVMRPQPEKVSGRFHILVVLVLTST